MYKKILACLDNSDDACSGIDLGVAISKQADTEFTGCHVYAAKLHNERFIQMEDGLPPQYQNEEEIKRQRDTHDSLITRGLEIISDSYMTVLATKAEEAGVKYKATSREGKNYAELVAEANEGSYDLVILGALGLGEVKASRVGSVCERVVRRVRTDVLVSRKGAATRGKIVVGVDGSVQGFGGLKAALELAAILDLEVEAISAFDPDYHYTAFHSIAGVLTEEAGKLFKFKEQEKLHEEIIDKGLAKIYQDHLDTAVEIAAKDGVTIETTLLSGKPYEQIINYVARTKPFMLVMGRIGVHAAPKLDIGSNTENCLREVGCHLLISNRTHTPVQKAPKDEEERTEWTDGAKKILERIPPFARGVVKNMIEEKARAQGLNTITEEFMYNARKMMGGSTD